MLAGLFGCSGPAEPTGGPTPLPVDPSGPAVAVNAPVVKPVSPGTPSVPASEESTKPDPPSPPATPPLTEAASTTPDTDDSKPTAATPEPPATSEPPAREPTLPVAAAPEAEPTPVPKKVREVLFDKWPTPKLALFLTGRQNGYLEPCGCTGLTNQKGGLARRHTLFQELVAKEWPLVALDAGNQVRRFGRQAEIQFQMTASALQDMKYAAVGFGPDDLRLSANELLAVLANAEENPFVSANVTIVDPSVTSPLRIVTVAGLRIGITSVLGDGHHQAVQNQEITLRKAGDALAEVLPKLRAAKCDLTVLLAHTSLEEATQLAQRHEFDLVITTGGGDPTFQPEKIADKKSLLIQTGAKGMFVGVVGVFDGQPRKLRYQRIPLDDRFADSPTMIDRLANYQQQLETAGLDGLGRRPVPHASGRTFEGSEKCGECHTKSHAVWSKTPHSHALDSLVHPPERSEIARHFDPECLTCHVTGWNPQGVYPYRTGYLGLKETPKMHGVGCENCHGPGSAHVAAEEIGQDEITLAKLRKEMRLPLAEAERKCLECHDLDNSPDFHVPGAFEKYWKRIVHPGKD